MASTPMPDCSTAPKWIILSTSNLDVRKCLCNLLRNYEVSGSLEVAGLKVHTFEEDGEGAFRMVEEDWIRLFGRRERGMLDIVVRIHKR